jgi:hypothetical protein
MIQQFRGLTGCASVPFRLPPFLREVPSLTGGSWVTRTPEMLFRAPLRKTSLACRYSCSRAFHSSHPRSCLCLSWCLSERAPA